MRMKNFGTRLKKFWSENYKILLLFLVLSGVNFALLIKSFRQSGRGFDSWFFAIVILIFLALSIGTGAILLIAKKKQWKIEKVFLIIGSVLGLAYTFIIPIGRVPDEPAHLWRVYGITEGCIIYPKDEDGKASCKMPENVHIGNTYEKNGYLEVVENLSDTASENYVAVSGPADSYSPINYIPQVIGVMIGKIFRMPMVAIVYLGRICNLAFCVAIIYLSLKYIPFGKKALFMIACLPVTMQAFASVSADGTIICASIALISFVLYQAYGKPKKEKFAWWHYAMILALCVAITATKPVYAPICLLLFWIPKECFGGQKQKIIKILATGAATLALMILWFVLAANLQAGNGGDAGGQISFILSQPTKFLSILFNNLISRPAYYLNMTFGRNLEWLDINLNSLYIAVMIAVFMVLCIEERYEAKMQKSLKIFLPIAIGGILVMIFTWFYIQWSTVGSTVIEGVQGRYFLPFLLLVPLCFIPIEKRKPDVALINKYALYALIILVNIHGLLTVLSAHL